MISSQHNIGGVGGTKSDNTERVESITGTRSLTSHQVFYRSFKVIGNEVSFMALIRTAFDISPCFVDMLHHHDQWELDPCRAKGTLVNGSSSTRFAN